MATNTQRIAALEAWRTTAETRLSALEAKDTTLVAADAALDTRLDALEAPEPPPPPPPPPPPAGKRLYGNPNYTAGLQDIGTETDRDQSVRFKAHHTSSIERVIFYLIGIHYRTGAKTPGYGQAGYYASGDGGTLRWSLQRDDGTGKPDGVNIGNVVYADPMAFPYRWQSEVDYPVEGMSGWNVVAGQTYHLRIFNDHPSPASNWVSPDWSPWNLAGDTWVPVATVNGWIPRFDPALSDDDMAALSFRSGQWQQREGLVPIFQAEYASGGRDGFGYVNLSRAPGSTPTSPSITATNWVRERFTVSGGNRTVDQLHLRVAKGSTSTAPLVVRLRDAANNVLWTVAIPAASVPTWVSGDTHGTSTPLMALQSLGAPKTLTDGATYSLELSTSGSSTYYLWAGKTGYGYGYDLDDSLVSFGDRDPGLQSSTNSGGSWATYAAGDYDLMFYLTEVT